METAGVATESVVNIDGTVRYVFAKVGHATLIKLPIAANRVAVGDPNILDFTMISPRELYVLGKSVGTTNMILWEGSGRSIVIPAAVNVDLEPLSASIRNSLPQEQDMKISSIAGSIVLSGMISDGLAAKTALDLASAFVGNLNRQIEAAGKQQTGGSGGNQSVSSLRVIDLLRLRDSQQVMLEVRIAEINKKLLEQLGVGINRLGTSSGNSTSYTIFSQVPLSTTANGGIRFVNGGTTIEIEAEKRDSMLKILAEPTIVAMSGQEGSFLAGGTVYVPAGFSTGGVPGQPVEKEYGVSLKFLPTVLDGGRISLRVAPEVSELDTNSPVPGYPAFLTRKVATTVQLRSGQSLMIGGLLRNNLKQAISAFPILGELPIIGALFRSSDYMNDKTELVVIVSPSVIKASEAPLPLPTDNFKAPSRTEFFIEGSMEKK
jgi:pilus assembly protein CpaC